MDNVHNGRRTNRFEVFEEDSGVTSIGYERGRSDKERHQGETKWEGVSARGSRRGESGWDLDGPGLTVRAVNTLGGKVGQLFKVGVPVHPPSSPPGISSEDGEEPVGLEKATYMTISFS